MIPLFSTSEASDLWMARAIVRENQDPDKRGRVKVEYPWLHGSSADLPSEWARVCQPYASEESGAWFVPDVGDEVVVFFENGNPDFPIVMGSLYNPKHQPPKSGRAGDGNDDGKNHLKFIKTRTGKLIALDDNPEKGGIALSDEAGNRVEIFTKEKKVRIEDGGKSVIELDGEGKKIQVKDASGNHIEIANGKIEVANQAGSKVVLEGGKATLHGAGEIRLGEMAMHALVKGDVFQALFNSHTHMTAWGPSSPPMIPMTPAALSQTVKTS